MPFDVLVIGGYGNFGKRISQNLSRDKNIQLCIAGRNFVHAQHAAFSLNDNGAVHPVTALALDINADDFPDRLRQSNAQLVIHTSGPFQGQDYHVAESCLETGMHYVDLADSRDFVCGFNTLDQSARDKRLLLVSGASSVPALSAAAIDRLSSKLSSLDSIQLGIAPGNRAERGEATIKAILSYTGQAFTCWRSGSWQTIYGWQGLSRHDFGDPVGKRWLSDCNVPDLELFPQRYPGVKEVIFKAGLELGLLHLGLWLLSGLSRVGLVKDWSRYTKSIMAMSGWFGSFGSDDGAMFVRVRGTDMDGHEITHEWGLLARRGDGPCIPTLSAVILAKKMARNELLQCGAQVCVDLITLDEFLSEMKARAITVYTRTL